jgi:hypothetical protein
MSAETWIASMAVSTAAGVAMDALTATLRRAQG